MLSMKQNAVAAIVMWWQTDCKIWGLRFGDGEIIF